MASNRQRGPFVTPDIDGPRIRVGIFWFLILLAAISSGVVWTAVLWAYVAAVAALQMLDLDDPLDRILARTQQSNLTGDSPLAMPNPLHLIVAVVAASFPLMAAYNLPRAGWMLILIPGPLAFVAWILARNPRFFTRVATAIVLPALASIAVVATVQVSVWSALFLVIAVSLYDTGAFLIGAESKTSWEGPAGGILGIAAATFVFSILEFAPYTRLSALIIGLVLAITCPLGQWVVAQSSPAGAPPAAMRRLDAYVIAGPLFVSITWLL